MMSHFHFLRPAFFALLPVIVILLWLYEHRKVTSRSWKAACDPELLPHLLVGGSQAEESHRSLYLLGIGSLLAVFALAGPVWKQLETPVFRDQSALVLILDLSRSMNATDINPTRLSRARHKTIDILKRRTEGQTALVIYAGGAFVVSPLTQDAKTIINMVSALKTTLIPKQGSRPDLAILKARTLLKQAGVPKGEVLLITDGLENVPPDPLAKSLAALLYSGHRLSILGVGTLEGAPIKLEKGGYFRDKTNQLVIPKLDEAALNTLAAKGKGRYSRLSSDETDIHALFSASSLQGLENNTEETGLKADRWREEGPWLLLLLLPFVAATFRRGILIVTIFYLSFFLPQNADALDWDTLWSRTDQRAQANFDKGETDIAASLFEDPEWRAAAQYRSGNYQKSIDSLEGIQNPDALYNKGNALARLGSLTEAISAYDEALALNPEHKDAAYNKEQIQKQMSKDDPKQNQENNGDSSESPDDSEKPEGEASESEDSNEGEEADSESAKQDQETNRQDGDETSDSENDQAKKNDADEEESGENNEEKQASNTESEDNPDQMANNLSEQDELGEQKESQLALEQWLRRVPDDPGGLLRRKFLYQSQLQPPTNHEEAGW